MRCERGHVVGQVAAGEQSAVNGRVECLHPAIKHFRKTGVGRDLSDREARIGQQFRGSAGGEQLNAKRMQRLGKFNDTGLV